MKINIEEWVWYFAPWLWKSQNQYHHPIILSTCVCFHLQPWIYSWRWALYFSFCLWGQSRDILQPSHVLRKNCQWVRSENFCKITEDRLLICFNLIHLLSTTLRDTHGKPGRVQWSSFCLRQTANYLVKVTNLITSLLLSLFYSSPSPVSLHFTHIC